MVSNNNSYEEQTRRLLSDAISELNTVESQIRELEGKRAKLKAESQAYELALEGYLRRTGRQLKKEPDWYKLLRDQTNKDRLITLAENSGGRIKASEATDLLYSRHLIKAAKRVTAYSIVQGLLIAMAKQGRFEKVGPGEYRLVDTEPAFPALQE